VVCFSPLKSPIDFVPVCVAGGIQLIADNAQDFKFVGGSQLISDRMAASLGDRVLLNSPVAKITWNPSGSGESGLSFPPCLVVVRRHAVR
jgi:predicted NAD/FAD-binding protein